VPSIPRDPNFDATIAAYRDPYRYISRRARELETDVFATRLMLRPALCLTGREGARFFYDSQSFRRAGAAPEPLRATLFGRGGVQGLDGSAHRHRKELFLSIMTSPRIETLAEEMASEWRAAALRWEKEQRPVPLYRATQGILARSVCRWAGIPLSESEADARTRDLVLLFDAAGHVGPDHFRARLARRRCTYWVLQHVEALRLGGGDDGAPEQPVEMIARHRDLSFASLPAKTAAVEILNVLRPTVALSVYCVFLAHALARHPTMATQLRAGSDEDLLAFVQEVRRFYPFFPAVAARVREDVLWRDHSLRAGTLAVLDLYGIDHDPRLWKDPDTFRPERFHGWNEDPYGLVPQGGGDHAEGHRCAGEWITIALMETALRFLTDEIDYRVRRDDLAIDFSRLPALPQEPLVLEDVSVRSSS
jgi:fatty-acid peroxygenase